MNVAAWFGADPERVGALIGFLDRAREGRLALLVEREKSSVFGPALVRTLSLVAAVLFGLFVGGLLVVASGLPGIGLVVTVLGLLVSSAVVLIHGIPLLLDTDDAQVIGHWPVTARDVGAARMLLLLRGVLEATLAFAVVPCAVLLFVGAPRVLVGVVTAGAVVAQAVLVTALLALALLLLRRTFGRRRAQKIVGAAFFVVFFLGAAVMPTLADRAEASGAGPPAWGWALLPLFWCMVWPVLFETSWAVGAGVGLGSTLATAGLVLLTVRTIAGGGRADRVEARRSSDTQGRIRWLETLLWPWMPGVRALVPRRLVVAHLRDDWRVLLRLFHAPLMFVVVMVGPLHDVGPLAIVADRDGFRWFHLFVIVMASVGVANMVALVSSSQRRASWVLVASPVAHGPWAAWQRGMARATSVPWAVLIVLGLHVAAGSTPWRIVDDLVVVLLTLEVAVRGIQRVQWRAPFSLDPSFVDGRFVAASVLSSMTVLPATVAYLAFVHAKFAWAPPLTWAMLLLAVVLLDRSARRAEPMTPTWADA